MSKCSPSNPLLHFFSSPRASPPSLSLFRLLLQVSSHLLIWLSILLCVGFFSSCHARLSLLFSFLPSSHFPHSIQLPLNSLFLLCCASCPSIVFPGFSQSLLSVAPPSYFSLSSSSPHPLFSVWLSFFVIPFPFFLLHCHHTIDSSSLSSSLSLIFSPTPSFSHPLIPCFPPPLSRLASYRLHSEYSGYSSFTNTQDLWMTTAGLHCHHKIATVLYAREMREVCVWVCVFSVNPAAAHVVWCGRHLVGTRTTLLTEIALNSNPLWLFLSSSSLFLSPLLLSWNTSLFYLISSSHPGV